MAQLLEGMARSQMAIMQSMVDEKTWRTQVIPAIQGQGQLFNSTPQPVTLDNIWARMLLNSSGARTPDRPPVHEYFAKELDRLFPPA
ncbi:MAG: hypothetical protein HOQ10_09520 [Frateuria sp.]|nr:hypothetical protein [Frateuria sp.]